MMTQFDDPNMNQYESPQTEDQQKKGLGCFVWGCLVSLAVLLVLVLFAWWAAPLVVGKLVSFAEERVIEFTDEKPTDLPVVEASDEEIAELTHRVENLGADVHSGEGAGELALTSDDINKLIAVDETLKGRVFVAIEGGVIKCDLSIPSASISFVEGRYFNAVATLDASLADGILSVTLVDAEVKGERLPQGFLDAIANQNLVEEVIKDPKNAEILRQFESIEVRDNKLILKMREGVNQPAAELEPAGAAEE